MSSRGSLMRGLAVFAAGIATSNLALGAEVNADLTVGGQYTDNLFLSTSPNEVDDTVVWVSPTISVLHESTNLDGRLRYRFDWFDYQDTGTTTEYHNYDLALTGKTWKDRATLEVGGNRSQAIRDPNDVLPPGRLPITGNLIDRDQGYVAGRLTSPIGTMATFQGDYRYTLVRYDESGIQGNDDQDASLELDNYRGGSGIAWALRYQFSRTDYEISPLPFEFRRASAELGYWINANTRIFGSGGRESPWDDPTVSSLEDDFWEAGFAFSAGEDLKLELAVGERDYGSSWRGELQYKFKRGGTSVSYTETPTTTGRNRVGRRPVIDPEDLDEFLDVAGDTSRFISKKLQWDTNLEFRRTRARLVVFNEERTGRVQVDRTMLEDQRQTGVRLRLGWDLGARTSLSLSSVYVDRRLGDINRSASARVAVSAGYRLGARTRVSLAYIYAEENPEEGEGTSTRDYFANTVSLSVNVRLLN